MNTINIAADATAQRIGIGNQYENEATAVVFDCSQFAEAHGAGTAQVIHRRPTESIGYVCTNVSQTNNTATWLVTDDDTSFTGKGQVQLRWYVNDVLRESVIFPTYILPSVASSDDAPAEVKSALEQLMEWVNDNTISIEDLDERIANYFDEHPIPTPVTSVNEKLGDVVLTAEDVGAYSTEEADEKFCVTDGEYEELNAGTAKQLLSDSYTLDQVPYLYRKSPDSDRAVEEIVGGSVGWNQMINKSIFDVTSTVNGITMTGNRSTGEVTVSGTATADATLQIISGIVLQNTHVYFLKQPQGASASTFFVRSGASSFWNYKSIGKIEEPTGTTNLRMFVKSGQTVNFTFVPQLFDLTTMLGSTIADYIYSLETATAGAGVAKLKEWGFFTEDYYPYCLPTIRSVSGLVEKRYVGFNQWDEEWEAGYYSTTGIPEASNNSIRCKNYIPVFANTTYYIKSSGLTLYICQYDADKNFIGTRSGVIDSGFITLSNCRYLRFNMATAYGSTYNNDICINLSDPARNGQYEPYESHTYSLDSEVVLRGVPKLDSNNNLYYDGDVYPADGQGKRRFTELTINGTDIKVGKVTLHSNGVYYCTITLDNRGINTSIVMADSGYLYMNGSVAIGSVYITNVGGTLVICLFDQTLTTVTAVNDYLASHPITVLYELATPTTFTATPYHNPQIVVDTEEFVTTGLVPVGHSTKYYQNLRKKIENLPWNFATLIAPTEVTNKATRNYTTGSYLILNNVLYKVTSNIANGGTITPNTNCTATTIMAEFMSL